MKVKSLVQLAVLISVGSAVVLGWLLISTLQRVDASTADNRLANDIVRGVFEKNILMSDYLLHREQRAQTQWWTRHDSLGELLHRADEQFKNSRSQTLLKTVREAHESSGSIFSDLIMTVKNQSPTGIFQSEENRLINRLSLNSQDLVSATSLLADLSGADVTAAQRTAKWLVTTILVTMVAITVSSLLLIIKKVLRPISQLQFGTEIIGQGDLGYRTGIKSRDEIGSLSAAFDYMTEKLEASRDERDQAAAEVTDALGQLKGAQAQLVQAGKMAGLGQIGAGIAHELNQPITSIQGFAQRLRRNGSDQMSEGLDIIINASHRMARIVDNIRDFARQSEFNPEPTPPLEPLDDALMLVSEQLRLHGVDVEKKIGEIPPHVPADKIRLQQVFLNLLSNALDALDELPEGAQKKLVLGVQADRAHVLYSIEDNGPGIPDANESLIFDPFYTTKPPGKGTGLGLALSHGIVADHGGQITYQPSAGGGALFTVRIPRAPKDSERRSEKAVASDGRRG